jgi:hypothetical protein
MSALIAQPLSSLTAYTAVHWLWERYLPRGKLAILDGDPGVGKSLLAIDIAARLSRGAPLPDGSPGVPPCATLLLSAEDGPDTFRPRAEAAGADLDRIVNVTRSDGLPPSLPSQLRDLENFIRGRGAEFVVIDPLVAFLGPEAAANADQCVRRALTPLAEVAAYTGAAILLVRHLCKSEAPRAVMRGQGSVGIIGAARTGLLAAHHPADSSLGVLAVGKSNLSVCPPSLGYRVKPDAAGRPVVEWVGPVGVSADGLGRPEAALRPRDRAALWLAAELAPGPRRAAELLERAAEVGIPERTLRRAKDQSGVRARRGARGGEQEWYWYDPEATWPAGAPFKKPCELPPLPPPDPHI